jgi:hypothetical protein
MVFLPRLLFIEKDHIFFQEGVDYHVSFAVDSALETV